KRAGAGAAGTKHIANATIAPQQKIGPVRVMSSLPRCPGSRDRYARARRAVKWPRVRRETKRNGRSGIRRTCNFTSVRRMACCASTECVPCGRRRCTMPEKETIERAHKDAAQGKSTSTQAGEFVREEMHHVREGKHGARSPKQAIAIGLSKARRAGVKLPPPPASANATTKRSAASASRAAGRHRKISTRSALKREGRSAASRKALSRQATT